MRSQSCIRCVARTGFGTFVLNAYFSDVRQRAHVAYDVQLLSNTHLANICLSDADHRIPGLRPGPPLSPAKSSYFRSEEFDSRIVPAKFCSDADYLVHRRILTGRSLQPAHYRSLSLTIYVLRGRYSQLARDKINRHDSFRQQRVLGYVAAQQ